MKQLMTMGLLSLMVAGCVYKAPLTEEHILPVDPDVLGVWADIEDQDKDSEDQDKLTVLPFSETEYMVVMHSASDGPLYLRGYPIELGGHSMVQIEMIGCEEMDISEPDEEEEQEGGYHVVKYSRIGDELTVAVLNPVIISEKIETTAELREAFIKNSNNPDLFGETTVYKDLTGRFQERRLLQAPTIIIRDKTLNRYASAHPIDPTIAILTTEGDIRIYTFEGEVVQTLKHEALQATALSYSPNGTQLLVGTENGSLLIWDFDSNAWNVVAEKVSNRIGRVAWLGNKAAWGTYIRYFSKNRKPINRDKPSGGVIDLSTGETCWTFQSHARNDFQTLVGSPDGSFLATVGLLDHPQGLYLLSAEAGEPIKSFGDNSGLSVCISPDGRIIANKCTLYDRGTGQQLHNLKGHSNWIVDLAFSPDGKLFMSGSGDSTARIWSVVTGEELGRIRFPGSSTYVYSVGFSPDEKKAYALAQKGQLKIIDCPTLPSDQLEKQNED